MSNTSTAQRSANLTGSLWMIAAMAGFAVEDALLKSAAKTLPIGQVMLGFGIGGALVFALLARATGARLLTPDVMSAPMRIRALFEITGRLFYTLALALVPLSTATVILQATPLVVVAGAALVFGEQVGWRRWLAICIGMAGVVIMVRPGTGDVSLLSLLAVLGMLGFAGRDLASRAAPASLGTSVLGFYGFVAIILAGIGYSIWDGSPYLRPQPDALLKLAGAALIGVAAYASLMKAMRTGDVSAVTPFRYSRMLFGIALGLIVFDESLTRHALIGSALIVASGLFIVWRGKRIAPEPG